MGFLKPRGDQLYFVCLEKKYPDLLVRDVKPELYDVIKSEDEIFGFSYIIKTKLQEKYVERHFFKAEFMSWSPFE